MGLFGVSVEKASPAISMARFISRTARYDIQGCTDVVVVLHSRKSAIHRYASHPWVESRRPCMVEHATFNSDLLREQPCYGLEHLY